MEKSWRLQILPGLPFPRSLSLPPGTGDLGKVAATDRPCFNTLAISPSASHIVVGSRRHHLLLFSESLQCLRVLQVAHDEEVAALALHPVYPLAITGCLKGELRFWNTDPETAKPVPGRVMKHPSGVTSAVFSDDGNFLALGHEDGRAQILSFPDLQPQFLAVIAKERIADARFSPSGKICGFGSWDQQCTLVERTTGWDTASLKVLRGNTSSITQLMFSADSEIVMTNSKDIQVLYFNVDGSRETAMRAFRDTHWQEPYTCILGWPTCGIWATLRDCDITDINAVCSVGDALCVGCDDHTLKLFRYPCATEPLEMNALSSVFKNYTGHAGAVLNVRSRDNLVASVGGTDHALFLYRYVEDDTNPIQPWSDPGPKKLVQPMRTEHLDGVKSATATKLEPPWATHE